MSLSVTDDRGRRIELARPAQRLVSLVPSDTYTLLRLGAGARLVGRTRYCIAPAEVESIPSVGGVRDPDVAQIIALRPDLVVANREDNRERHVRQLEAAGVAVLVSHPTDVRAGIAHAERLAGVLAPADGAVAQHLASALASWQCFAEREVAAVPTIVPVWLDPIVAVGRGCFADDMLRLLGAENVAASKAGTAGLAATAYPRLDPDAVAALGAELVLLPDEPYSFSEAEADRFGALPCASLRSGHPLVRRCDGADLFWYGLRAVEGLKRLDELLAAVRAELSTKGRR